MELYIGNQNYSTWSLRAWALCEQFSLNVDYIKLMLDTPAFYSALTNVNPAAKVPALIDGDIHVWESLAILEYLNETYLNGDAWPANPAERAKARAIACEMHAGFAALRHEMPMNCRAKRTLTVSTAAQKDIARIDRIWSEQMQAYPDGWLFGQWSIADAMFAPVVLRFATYGTPLSAAANHYQQKMLHSDVLQRWLTQALAETEIVTADEAGTPV